VTKISETYSVDISCEVGGTSGNIGWGLATIKGDDKILDSVIDEVKIHQSVGKVTIKNRSQGVASFLVDVVKCRACEVLLRSKAFMVFPVEIHKGWMKWIIITDNNITIGRISRKLEEMNCDVKIERVTPLRKQDVLTDRQNQVIRKAFEVGYFNYPRRMDMLNLAKELNI